MAGCGWNLADPVSICASACQTPGGKAGMDHEDLRQWSKRAADWAADYHAGLRDRPVRAPLVPGAIGRHLPAAPPDLAEPIETIWADFERIVPDGMTHWQHPRFFAYFPANAAPAHRTWLRMRVRSPSSP